MLTLILSNLITIENYQKIIAIISLCIDVIASLVLIIRVLKTKKMTPKEFEKIIKSLSSNKQTILKTIRGIISRLEKEQEDEQKNEQKQKKSTKKKEHKEKSEG